MIAAVKAREATDRLDAEDRLDRTKLLRLIDELNNNFARGDAYAAHVLLRAILDHVPPLLGCANFAAVANNYRWSQTDKGYMRKLLDFKLQADDVLHRQISPQPDLLGLDDMPPKAWLNRLLQQQADAPSDWFEEAQKYLTQKLHGATAPLRPAGKGMGKTAGYIAADYLLQHAIGVRRTERVPASTWNALLRYVQVAGDARRLASSAACRLLYRYAVPLYCRAIDAGDKDAAYDLADFLVRCGDLDGLRSRADAGDSPAADRLNEMLAKRGDLDGLRSRADAGDSRALDLLIKLLAERGDLEGLRAYTDAGDSMAANRLDGLLAERGDVTGLRARADGGDIHALHLLVNLLAGCGEPGAATEILRQFAEAGVDDAAIRLARMLAKQGDLSELRARTKGGDLVSTRLL